jgi:thiol-disulfide isomerase/thioredoxin
MTRRVGALLLLVTLAAAAGAPAGFASGSAKLVDPRTGREVVLEPGASALHLVFFATWCPPCVEELARLGEVEARWSERGYRLVLVGVRTRQTSERLAGFVEQEQPPGQLLFDAEGDAERAWQVKRLPTHVVLDSSGREVARASELDESIETAIAELLAATRGRGRGR